MRSPSATAALLVALAFAASACGDASNVAADTGRTAAAIPSGSSQATSSTAAASDSSSSSWSVAEPVVLTSAKVHFGEKAARAAGAAAIGAFQDASFDEKALTAMVPQGRGEILAVARRWMTPSRFAEFVKSADSFAATGKDDDDQSFNSWTWWGAFSMKDAPGYRLDPDGPLLADAVIKAVTVSADGDHLRVEVTGQVDAHYLHKTKVQVQRLRRTSTLSMLPVHGHWLVDGWSSTWSSAMVPATH